MWINEHLDPQRIPDEARLNIWATVKMAEARVPEALLFTLSGPGRVYRLVPEPRSTVPYQWAHFGPGAIPNALADLPCGTINASTLLTTINTILGTTHSPDTPGLQQCLEHFLRTSRDFGQAYAFLRGHWHTDLTTLPARIASRAKQDDEMRWEAVHGDYFQSANVRPRRVWDLHSNRVLPFYALPAHPHAEIPDNVWTVSHSWVREDARAAVWTLINGFEWPVPVPLDTTLDHVRVELLNLGAEYVWLDVLCLRQKGGRRQKPDGRNPWKVWAGWEVVSTEPTRIEEWKLDVPTIGHIYSFPHVPCITYFNGLGLPFDPSPDTLSSDRHWLNRVWTVQETTSAWLPGGLTGSGYPAMHTFFHTRHAQVIPVGDHEDSTRVMRLATGLRALQRRHCTTELDRIASLAYIARCHTLPLYDDRVPVERAWVALLKHFSPEIRAAIFLRHVKQYPRDTALWPSWEQFLGSDAAAWPSTQNLGGTRNAIHLLPGMPLGTMEPGVYFQRVRSYGTCRIVRESGGAEGANRPIVVECQGGMHHLRGQMDGRLRQNKAYTFLQLEIRTLLMVEVIGERTIEERTAYQVIKCGCMLLAAPCPTSMVSHNVTVVYQDKTQ
ncbi:hypothetical protein PsYK624_143860 [Phanerochaete sordida]|uniref:Heterokaryon incompatibility domain-containing protein n=1 Tax=Phanerochaete sordida TaxID=48140 RepID=A0A9P3GRN8_9APHY|nr:hypothetical protein PsYK624_143860 [Phanerochaete sordida]